MVGAKWHHLTTANVDMIWYDRIRYNMHKIHSILIRYNSFWYDTYYTYHSNTIQYGTLQYVPIRYITILLFRYNMIGYNMICNNTFRSDTICSNTIHLIPFIPIRYAVILANTYQYCMELYHIIWLYDTFWLNMFQYDTIWYNTIQHETIRYETIQYNMICLGRKCCEHKCLQLQLKTTTTTTFIWYNSLYKMKKNST